MALDMINSGISLYAYHQIGQQISVMPSPDMGFIPNDYNFLTTWQFVRFNVAQFRIASFLAQTQSKVGALT